jgi:hypothetical protein
MRNALPVSAAGLHPVARAKANASFLAATLTASIPVVAAVAMVVPWIFFVRWAHVPIRIGSHKCGGPVSENLQRAIRVRIWSSVSEGLLR